MSQSTNLRILFDKDSFAFQIYRHDRIFQEFDRFSPGLRLFIANIFHMARKKDSTRKTEETPLLEYAEHMTLLKHIVRIIIRRDRVKERQRNTYD